MKTAIRTLSIISVVLMVLTFIAFAVGMIGQKSFMQMLDAPQEAMSGFALPAGDTVCVIAMTAMCAAGCLVAGNKTLGIWSDIMAIIFIGVVWGMVQSGVDTLQLTLAARKGAVWLAKLSMLQQIASIATVLMPAVRATALTALGMSIAYKKLTKGENN